MRKKELSEVTLKKFEEDFRNYKSLNSVMITALLSSEWKAEDLNSWIKGKGQPQSEKALNDLIKKEDNKAYSWNLQKKNAIERAYEKLPIELKHIVDEYMWGAYSYLHWSDIAVKEHCSKSTIYEWRYKILETYAFEVGEIF